MLGKIEGRRRRGQWRMIRLDSITDSMDKLSIGSNLSKFWEIVKNMEAWCAVVHGVTKNQTLLNDWTTIMNKTHVKRNLDFSFIFRVNIRRILICSRLQASEQVFLSLIVHAAAATKSLQSCLTLCNPIDGSSPGSTVLEILQARTLGSCHFLLQWGLIVANTFIICMLFMFQ